MVGTFHGIGPYLIGTPAERSQHSCIARFFNIQEYEIGFVSLCPLPRDEIKRDLRLRSSFARSSLHSESNLINKPWKGYIYIGTGS